MEKTRRRKNQAEKTIAWSLSSSQQNEEQEAEKSESDISAQKYKIAHVSHRVRCGVCTPCTVSDCGSCCHCIKKKQYGGTGNAKSPCIYRRCEELNRIKRRKTQDADRRKPPPPTEIQPKIASNSTTSNSKRAWDFLKDFQPASYLFPDYDDSTSTKELLTVEPAAPTDPAEPVEQFLYGLPVPVLPTKDDCAACFRSSVMTDEHNPVLICEGENCERDYHLQCCMPPLASVPEGKWLCWDCNKTGTTASLQNYLEGVDEKRVEYESLEHFRNFLLTEHLDRLVKTVGTNSPNPDGYQFPNTDITDEFIEKVHKAAMTDLLHKNATELVETAQPGPYDPDVYAKSPAFLVGKPVEIFDGTDPRVHVGRIVDYREDTFKNDKQVLYLVRFPAGADYRKTAYSHWIDLNEHILAVGTNLVWVERKRDDWVPAIVYLRSSQSIMSALGATASNAKDEELSPRYKSHSSKREKVYALTKGFSVPRVYSYCVRDMKSGVVRFTPNNMPLWSTAPDKRIQLASCQAEWYDSGQ
jgi:hypothetical protein